MRCLLILILLFIVSCNTNNTSVSKKIIQQQCNQLHNFYTPYDKPAEWTWRYQHPDEKYISLEEYIKSKPHCISKTQNTIYILPMGNFTAQQMQVIARTSDYLEAFYGTPVKQLTEIKMPTVPDSMKRIKFDQLQYNATYFIDNYLNASDYKNASVLIALTNFDLYPSNDWNFVFGLAALQKRVGIWSINRLGNPSESEEEFQKCLLRTQKIATHEIGHLFSIRHCTVYPCVMNGSNTLSETDLQPLLLCPNCLEKLSWNFKTYPQYHCNRLHDFWKENKNDTLASIYEEFCKSLDD